MKLQSFSLIARFYQVASESALEEYEAHLDRDDRLGALRVLDSVLNPTLQVVAAKDQDYLSSPPERGDMVFIQSSGRFAKLLAVSDDGEKALVKEQMGAYVVPFSDLRRIR